MAIQVGVQRHGTVVICLDVAGAHLGALVDGQGIKKSRGALLERVIVPAEVLLQMPAFAKAMLQLVAHAGARKLVVPKTRLTCVKAAVNLSVAVG